MDFDVVIIGGGLVGVSFALALRVSGLKVALIEARDSRENSNDTDCRVYTVSPGSVKFLESMGVWKKLDQSRVSVVQEMRVFGNDNKSSLSFEAYRHGFAHLAHIVEHRNLQNTLNNLIQSDTGLSVYSPAQPLSINSTPGHVEINISNGDVLRSRLLVGADGADSWVRRQTGFISRVHPYRQTAIVANLSTEKSHNDTAWQWFRTDGVLALLPRAKNKVSLVWSIDDGLAQSLTAMPARALAQKIENASQGMLGKLHLESKTLTFPLRLLRLDHVVKPRIALIGDAAHNIHPLAGQGVNLGFQDARALANCLLNKHPQQDCGDYFLLRQYERKRKTDTLALQLLTDNLQKLFNSSTPELARVCNFGLKFTDHLPYIKNLFVRYALN